MPDQEPIFQDRTDAGRQLALTLESYRGRADAIVLALPRGGVPVGFEIARELNIPLDIFVVRKLGTPGQEELAMGAVASGGTVVVNNEVVEALAISPETLHSAASREMVEIQRRERELRGNRPPLDLRGRTVILVDDGLATGSTMQAAIAAVRALVPAWIVAAVPVGAASACRRLRNEVDELVCLAIPEKFYAVGEWYSDFSQLSDEELRSLLQQYR